MIDKSALLAARTAETREVELPGLGGSITLRGATRAELKRSTGAKDAEKAERELLAAVIVDPELSPAEVGQWLEVASVAEVAAVQAAFSELSGLDEDAVKAAYARFRD